MIETWLDLLHFRERVTKEDRAIEDDIRTMLTEPPKLEFLVAAERQPHRSAGPGATAGA